MKPYYTDELDNEAYHSGEGISSSNIKLFMEDPSLVVWSKNAPQDQSKMDAQAFGTDFHAYTLEPDYFNDKYQVMQKFDRRKKDEKQAELDLIEEWKQKGIIAVTNEDMAKLKAMKESMLAHPTAKELLGLPGISERSFFWQDEESGLICKCRPDRLIEGITDENRPVIVSADCETIIIDIKTIGDIDKIESQSENFGYYISDAMYSDGVAKVTGTKTCFILIFVSTKLSLGRYPVKVVEYKPAARLDGRDKYKSALKKWAGLNNSPAEYWNTLVEMDRPAWAVRQEEEELFV